MEICDKTGIAAWCTNRDVLQVQLRSQAAGAYGTNKYDGPKVYMCQACRKSNNGGFKIVKPIAAAADAGRKGGLDEVHQR